MEKHCVSDNRVSENMRRKTEMHYRYRVRSPHQKQRNRQIIEALATPSGHPVIEDV